MVSLAAALTAIGCGARSERREAPAPRVVSLAPALTAIVTAVGGAEHLVGVTLYCEACTGDARLRPSAETTTGSAGNFTATLVDPGLP